MWTQTKQCLVIYGRRRKHIIFISFHFSLKKILLKIFFPLILKFYFAMVLCYYFASFFHFPWPINYNHTFRWTKFSTYSLPNWFWSNFFSFAWIHGIVHDHVLWVSRCTNEWKPTLKVIFKFGIDLAPLWWKSWIVKNAPFVSKSNPLELGIIDFF
jgi:hypothetical protein